MADKKDEVKQWYDGFCFGKYRDIYNPWSITNYLEERKLHSYWVSTSSNGLVSRLIRTASGDVKEKMEDMIFCMRDLCLSASELPDTLKFLVRNCMTKEVLGTVTVKRK